MSCSHTRFPVSLPRLSSLLEGEFRRRFRRVARYESDEALNKKLGDGQMGGLTKT
jgi:hypothetical protein